MKKIILRILWVISTLIFYFLVGFGGVGLVFNLLFSGIIQKSPVLIFLVEVIIIPILGGFLTFHLLAKLMNKSKNKYPDYAGIIKATKITLIVVVIIVFLLQLASFFMGKL